MNGPPAGSPEVTRFLREHPPFDALALEVVEHVAVVAFVVLIVVLCKILC